MQLALCVSVLWVVTTFSMHFECYYRDTKLKQVVLVKWGKINWESLAERQDERIKNQAEKKGESDREGRKV